MFATSAFPLCFERFRLLETHAFVEGLAHCISGVREIPEPLIVISIGRLDDIGSGVELNAHLPKIIAEKSTDAAADCGVCPAHAFGKEQVAAFVHPSVRVEIGWVEQSAGEPRHQSRRRKDATRLCKMEW